ncbi:MerR family transcriptional regulator, partial [Glaciimonas sp. Cout2]|nr:MerR family transcriptional regulator [Glaciimonas sp. Cout2]
ARVPPDLEEIVLLCETALAAHPSAVVVARGAGAVPGPRRLDEQALTELMAAGNKVECECPRHLSEILLMLGSFERYSAQ